MIESLWKTMPKSRQGESRRLSANNVSNRKMNEDEEEGSETGGWMKQCVSILSNCWAALCCCFVCWSGEQEGTNALTQEQLTPILQEDGDSGEACSNRHDSFTSASISVGSCSNHSANNLGVGPSTSFARDRGDSFGYPGEKSGKRGSNAGGGRSDKLKRKDTAPFIDLRLLDFWTGFVGPRGSTSEPQTIQPNLLLSPGRRDTISSQGSSDQIRPDLYEKISADEESGGECECTGPLGSINFFLSYDLSSNTLIIRLIQARDLPRPASLDSTKTDQAHSNPYVKICLLPNQKDSRQTTLRKKTQNPRFDETFSFEIPLRELERRTLQMLVKDFDKYSRHRGVGQVLLPCADINLLKGAHFWRCLEPVQSCQEDLGEILFSLCYLPAAGRLNVDILRAKQLLPTDLVGGAAPYARVSVVINDKHVKTKKTSYKKYTLEPVFNESLSFDVNCVQLQDCTVVISVLDFNGGVVKDNFIGRIVLGKEASGGYELNHWKNMVQSQRTGIAQWHSLKSKAHCDQLSPASKIIN